MKFFLIILTKKKESGGFDWEDDDIATSVGPGQVFSLQCSDDYLLVSSENKELRLYLIICRKSTSSIGTGARIHIDEVCIHLSFPLFLILSLLSFTISLSIYPSLSLTSSVSLSLSYLLCLFLFPLYHLSLSHTLSISVSLPLFLFFSLKISSSSAIVIFYIQMHPHFE